MASITWDVLSTSGKFTTSDEGKTLDFTGTYTGSRYANESSHTVNSGKWYFEVKVNHNGGETHYTTIGVGKATITDYPGGNSNGWGYRGNGNTYHNNNRTGSFNSYTTGDVVCVAIDLDEGEIWFGKNGVWEKSGDPETGYLPHYANLTGDIRPVASGMNTGNSYTGQFASFEQTYTAPEGFEPLQESPPVLAHWEEPYNIGYTGRVLSYTEPYHNISDYLTTGYAEPMAYALLASWREPYRSTPQHLAFWREPYLAAPEYIRSFVEPYISAAEVMAFWREEWTEQPAILAAWVEPYRVADAALLVSITEPYSLEEMSQLMPYWKEQYAMTIGTSLYQRVERVH